MVLVCFPLELGLPNRKGKTQSILQSYCEDEIALATMRTVWAAVSAAVGLVYCLSELFSSESSWKMQHQYMLAVATDTGNGPENGNQVLQS